MAENGEHIEYSPEELEEIQRITEAVPETLGTLKSLRQQASGMQQPGSVDDEFPQFEEESVPREEESVPQEDAFRFAEDISDIPEPAEEAGSVSSDEEEPVEDITGLIHEIEPEEEPVQQDEDIFQPDEEAALPEEELFQPESEEDISQISEEEAFPEEPEGFSFEEEEPGAEADKARSPLEELGALTEGEPESVDEQDIPRDIMDEEPAFPDFEEAAEEPSAEPGGVELEDAETDIPDLTDISAEEMGDMDEASESDLPDIDIEDLSEEAAEAADDIPEELPDETPPSAEMESMLEGVEAPDIEDLGEGGISPADEIHEAQDEEALPGFEDETLGDLGSMDDIDRVVDEEPLPEEPDIGEIEPLDEGEGPAPMLEEGVELSDQELKKMKKALFLYNPSLRKAIKNTILNDRLPPQETRQLVDLIIGGKPEDNVRRFLEKKLGISIDISEEEEPSRRVLTSRPEYSREGMERQKRVLRNTKIAGIAALIAFLFTIIGYQYVYKPVMAKRYIEKGVALIREPGDPVSKKVQDYKKAEDHFTYVDENYRSDYLYGYNAYARAYFVKKEYDRSYRKLAKAYEIDKTDVETLNNVGYFFSRVPENYYKRIRKNAVTVFYPEDKRPSPDISQLDISIDMYNRVLTLDKDNISAMYGIGNAYMYQGEYLKSRHYFENILQVEPDSAIGYSGLLNLFVERDNLPEVLSIHTDLRAKNMMDEIPSPLLGKLASFYMSKQRTEDANVRIDYGIQSKRLKDRDDNLYPAVRNVLDAMRDQNPDYPPLYLHSAKLARAQNNLKMMERLLKEAVEEAEDQGDEYFGALHMLGEYYYSINEPVESYRYLNRALAAYQSPASFTEEDFYYETESIGNTYAHLGHIFYYFFEKVKFRFGDDFSEENLETQADAMANLEIARKKYETALAEDYSTPEVYYNLGRIYYVQGNYEKALEEWLHLYEDVISNPEVMFSLGNAFYHLNKLEASKGEYLKLITVFENKAEGIQKVFTERDDHVTIFQSLASAYNNLGAIYQLQGDESKSSISYWKAIEYATRLNRENEFARVNMARSFKPRREPIMPILDENIPYSLDHFRKSMQ